MGEQLALLNTLDSALDYFRKVERERNQALTQLEALEQEVNILRALTPRTYSRPKIRAANYREPAAHATTVDPDGLYNHGYRDRVLRRLAETLSQRSDPGTRRRAAFALGVMGDSRSVRALSSALNDTDKSVRRQAAVALGRIGTSHVVVPLTAALRDGDKEVRKKAIEAIGKTGKPAIHTMISGLRDPNALVRRASSDALARIGVPAVSPLTRALLEEDDKLARIGAVETLGKMHDGSVVASLIVALMDPDTDIQDMAAQALVRTGKPAIPSLVRVLRIAGIPFRRRVADVLVSTRGLAIQPLIDAMGDENAEVRLAASEALVRIGRPTLQPLMSALRNSKPTVQMEAATVLGLIGDSGAAVPLAQAMKGRKPELRQRAAAALAKIGRPAAAPVVSLFKETDPSVREQAAQILVQIGRPAFAPLCRALYDADFSTRWQAAQVLDTLRSRGLLRGLHGKWERTIDDTLLLVWFNAGYIQAGTKKMELHGGAKSQSVAGTLMQRLPARQKRNLEESENHR